MIINELVTKLSFKQDKGLAAYERSMQAAKRSTERAAAGMERSMSRSSSAIKKMLNFAVKVDTSQAHSGLKGVSSSVSGIASSIKQMAAAYLSFQAASSASKFIFGATAEKETALTQLTTLVGKNKAGGIFADLQKFAATTPYELKDVMEMFNRLEGAGFGLLGKDGKVKYDMLIKLGDLASASNKPLDELTNTILSANRGMSSMVDNFVGLNAHAKDGALAMAMFDRASGKTLNKTIKEGDKAGLMDFFLMAGERKGIKGGMEAQSKTLSGQMSTLKDSAKQMATAFSSGFISKVHTLLDGMIKRMDKAVPMFEKFGKSFGKFIDDGIKFLPKLPPYLEAVVSGLSGIAGAYVILKGMALASWIMEGVAAWKAMDAAMRIAAISGAIANATIAWLPMLIAAGVAAVVWFGWQVYKYITQGTDSLAWMNQNFKWVADSIMFVGELIKTWWPIIEYTAKVIAGVLILAFQGLWILIQTGYDYTFKPVFDGIIGALNWVWDLIKSVTVENENWTAGVSILWEAWKGFLDWLKPILDAVGGTVSNITNAMSGWGNALAGLTGGGEAGPENAADPLNGFSKNGKLSNNLVAMSHQIKTLRKNGGDCLNVVYRIQQAALNGTSKITALHAADAAQQMASDKRFREIKVTKAMLTDPNFKAMLHGAQVFYNRNAGFSPLSGHAEVWDMSGSGSAYFGKGAIPLSQRSAHNLANARVFIPVNAGGGSAPVVNNTININRTNATPQQIQRAVTDGTGQALNKAGKQNRHPKPAGAVLG